MTDRQEPGKLRLAHSRLASDYPLHAGILAQWRIVRDPTVETMGVGYSQGQLNLYYAPDFVNSITLDELTGVLHHEVNHVLFDHVLHQPEPGENHVAMTIAQEVTVNEWVPESLPEGLVLLEDYPFLPEDEDTFTRYVRLIHLGDEDMCDGEAGDSGQGAGSNQGNGSDTVDNHESWQEVLDNADEARERIIMDALLASAGLDLKQREAIGEPFQSILNERFGANGIGCGDISGGGEMEVGKGKAWVPWRKILRRCIGKLVERKPVYWRPPRRFPHLAGIVPGRGRAPKKLSVMAVIDTSGSMSNQTIADIAAELAVMSRKHKVTVVECDCEVNAVYPYRKIMMVQGRGGTDLRPPLDAEFLKQQKADLVVYFTDGQGPAPDTPPKVPVIWCMTGGLFSKPVPWGKEIVMHPHLK